MELTDRVRRDINAVIAVKDKIDRYMPVIEKLEPLLKGLAPDAFAELIAIKEKIGPLVDTLEKMVADYKARQAGGARVASDAQSGKPG